MNRGFMATRQFLLSPTTNTSDPKFDWECLFILACSFLILLVLLSGIWSYSLNKEIRRDNHIRAIVKEEIKHVLQQR